MNKLILLGMVFLLFFGCTQEQTNNQLQNNTGTNGTVVFVEAGDYVEVEYTGYIDVGLVFDSNVGKAPLGFTAGAGQMIPGFDKAVIGMKVGEEKTVHLEPAEAYGEYNESLVMEFPLENVPEGVQVDDVLLAPTGMQGTVFEVTNETVKVDFNPQLAGVPLNFDIKVLKIN